MKKQAFNPYLPPYEFIPDGEPRVYDNRLYVYGSHDSFNGEIYCLGDYVCYSAPVDDLGNWTFEGVIFRKRQDPYYEESLPMGLIAPDSIQGPDGRYYLFYVIGLFSRIGVAVCDSPAGHYEFLGYVHFEDGTELNSNSGYGLMFDPAIYVENEDVYLYYGFGFDFTKYNFKGMEKPNCGKLGSYVVKLQPDMMTIIGAPKLFVEGIDDAVHTDYQEHPFFEASSMRKIGDRYYFVYSSYQGHELCYGISNAPDERPDFMGVIISNGDLGLTDEAVNYIGNNHGGLTQLNGKTYIFYHRHTNGTQTNRQGCAEEVHMDENGRIFQAEVTSCGLNNGPLVARGEYSCHIACHLWGEHGTKQFSSRVKKDESDAYITLEEDHGCFTSRNAYICNLRNTAGCGFKYFAFTNNETVKLEIRGDFEGVVHACYDGKNGVPAGTASIQPNGKWHTIEMKITPVQGVHSLHFTFEGKGSVDFSAIRF